MFHENVDKLKNNIRFIINILIAFRIWIYKLFSTSRTIISTNCNCLVSFILQKIIDRAPQCTIWQIIPRHIDTAVKFFAVNLNWKNTLLVILGITGIIVICKVYNCNYFHKYKMYCSTYIACFH